MSLASGTRLGRYEILDLIGAGSMGEVYRARDPGLAREVAIKVLPATFSSDPDRLRRFQQEARAAGALNHPNITAVLDVGEHHGAPYVVQELLHGETLRSALAARRLPPRAAIDCAIQIARGLSAAHDRGIVHRDLKPENVFLTEDGQVKILDFGVAKLTGAEPGALPVTDSPTATAGTAPGIVVGTVGYMSPEQVRGQTADARSDLFAVGAILYEMLSGNRAFRGESAADTLSAILREDPPDLSLTNRRFAPGLERIVRHCLEKNPAQRFQSVRDLAFDLESLSEGPGLHAEASPRGGRRRFASLVLLAAVLAAFGAGVVGGRLIRTTELVSHPEYHRLTFRRGPIWSARFAPDGQTVFYAASWDGAQKPQLFSLRVERPESLALALPEGQVESISRGGEMLLLRPFQFMGRWTRTGTLSRAALAGGASRDLLQDVADADWSPDGSAIAVVRAPGWRYRLEFPIGKILYEATGWISHPRVSPKGDLVAFLDHPVFGDDLGSVAIVDQSGKKTDLSEKWQAVQGLAWSPSGDEIWFTGQPYAHSTMQGSFRLDAVTLSGRQRTLETTPGQMILQDTAGDGRALFVQRNLGFGLFGLVAGDAKERHLSALDWSVLPLLSEDRRMVVFTDAGVGSGPGYSVYAQKLDGSLPVRLGEGLALAISPDGKWVLTCLVRSRPAPVVLLPTGAGEPKSFPTDAIDHAHFEEFAAFLPDGKRILFAGDEPGHPARMYVQDLAGGAARPVTPEGVVASLVSPDGGLLIRTGDAFAVTPLAGGPSRVIRGLSPTDRPLRWASDGRALFVAEGSRELPARVLRVDSETGRREVWKEFWPADPAGVTNVAPSAISADGTTIIFTYARALSELYLADSVR